MTDILVWVLLGLLAAAYVGGFVWGYIKRGRER